MPTITQTNIATNVHNCRSTVWAALANGDDGAPIPFCQYADKSVQVFGTFGAGGTVVFEGSNNGSNWAVLTDPQGSPLSFTTAGLRQIMELTLQVRPRVSGGDGTTNLSVVVTMKE